MTITSRIDEALQRNPDQAVYISIVIANDEGMSAADIVILARKYGRSVYEPRAGLPANYLIVPALGAPPDFRKWTRVTA
jgi:hypothetical protein